MKKIFQKCGWCRSYVQHRVMTNESASTGVADFEACPVCQARLLPYETADGTALVQTGGDPAKQAGEPAWAGGARKRPGP